MNPCEKSLSLLGDESGKLVIFFISGESFYCGWMEGKKKIFPIEIGKGKPVLIFAKEIQSNSHRLWVYLGHWEEKKKTNILLTDRRNIVISYTWLLNGFRIFLFYTKIISTE